MFKNKFLNLFLLSALVINLCFPIQVIAETFLPQDPGSVYDDLTGDYGVLGIASQFHVFAKEKTTINAHTEGNVATGVLSATNNFGTSISTGDLNKEINYAQSVETIISSTETAASVKRSNKFIVGSNNVITTENDKIVVNGTRLDHLSVDEFYQDREDAQYIDFNKEFENLMLTSNMLMSLDPLKTYTPDDFPDMNNRVIDCTDLVGDQPYVINVAASVLAKNTPLRINNPEGKVLIMNVVDAPTSFSVQSQIQYNNRSNHQTEDFSDANISWNFGNLTEKLEINAPFQGTIIAPCADITVNQSQDGTIIGKNVILNATTNRWDPNEIFAVPNTHDDTTDTTSSSTEPSTTTSSASSVSSTNEFDEPVISGEGTVESDGSGTMQMNDRRENKVALAVESNTNNDDPSTKNVQSQNQQLFPQTNGERNNLWIMVGAVLIYVVTLLFYRRKQV
ncbi:hypothetical protein [Enterococcus mundtii]|uniref:hypothetical protein n=1 Tax=Enterococcus mundtii TaxID=53346 RepID=UPI00397081FC